MEETDWATEESRHGTTLLCTAVMFSTMSQLGPGVGPTVQDRINWYLKYGKDFDL
jgi:hypothetical protein